ncbi:MAG: hypothetical protein KBT39_07825 [Bacteroidales bacterium]|nr:hypothetical protein [Bacteroidales bacterium]
MKTNSVANLELLNCLFKEEARILYLLSILACESISLENFFRTIHYHNRKTVVEKIGAFDAMGWVTVGYETVTCHVRPTDFTSQSVGLDAHTAQLVLSSLVRQMINRQNDGYEVPARLFLDYLLEERALITAHPSLVPIFAKAVVTFVPLYEMSLQKKGRELVHCLEDRLDFRLLSFVEELGDTPSLAEALRLKGQLLCENFRYEACEDCFNRAEALLGRQDAALMSARAWMLYNLGYLGKAIAMAYRAYNQGIAEGRARSYVDACILLSFLLAMANDMAASKQYMKCLDHISKRSHHRIWLKIIRALHNQNVENVALKYLDEAELASYRLYGANSPLMSIISHIRSMVYCRSEHAEECLRGYEQYVTINAYNFGFSAGSMAVLYSGIINQKLIDDDTSQIGPLAKTMNALCDGDRLIAPGVRMSCLLINGIAFFCLGSYRLARQNLLDAKCLCEELKPDMNTVAELRSIFHNGTIPADEVMMHHAISVIDSYLIELTKYQ